MVLGIGAAAALRRRRLLLLRGAEVWACDAKTREEFGNGALDETENMGGAHLLLSERHPEEHLAASWMLLIVSPGIPLDASGDRDGARQAGRGGHGRDRIRLPRIHGHCCWP